MVYWLCFLENKRTPYFQIKNLVDYNVKKVYHLLVMTM